MMELHAARPSRLATSTLPEVHCSNSFRTFYAQQGFVVRVAGAYSDAQFTRSIAKFVRRDHVQTAPDFKRSLPTLHCIAFTPCRTWRQATLT